jgi:hypothetical protein
VPVAQALRGCPGSLVDAVAGLGRAEAATQQACRDRDLFASAQQLDDSMLRELFPDLDLDMVKRVLGLDLTPALDDTEEEQ